MNANERKCQQNSLEKKWWVRDNNGNLLGIVTGEDSGAAFEMAGNCYGEAVRTLGPLQQDLCKNPDCKTKLSWDEYKERVVKVVSSRLKEHKWFRGVCLDAVKGSWEGNFSRIWVSFEDQRRMPMFG